MVKGLKTFAKKTGWPIEELEQLKMYDLLFLLHIHEMDLVMKSPKVKGRKSNTIRLGACLVWENA